MMTITVDAARPKAEDENILSLAIAQGTIAENDTDDNIFIPFNAESLNIPDFVVADVATVDTSDVVTTTGGGFSQVRVGDSIAAGTNIVASTVIAKTDDNTIQLSNAATADGTESLTFTPVGGGVVDLTLFGIEVQIVRQNSSLIVVFTAHEYDGSLAGTEGTNSNSTAQKNLNQIIIPLDDVLTNARIPRSN